CFTPQMMVGPTMWAESVKDQPPGAIVCFDQVGVACPLKKMRALIAMGQDGIMRAGFKRSPGASATCQRFHMSIFCPALSDQKIIPVAKMIQVRSFRKACPRGSEWWAQKCPQNLAPLSEGADLLASGNDQSGASGSDHDYERWVRQESTQSYWSPDSNPARHGRYWDRDRNLELQDSYRK